MATAKLNPKTDIPSSKTQITKQFMLGYIKEKGTEADKAWFKKIANDYKIERTSKLDGKTYQDIDIKPVRQAFCDRFFPQLNKSSNSFFDEVNNL